MSRLLSQDEVRALLQQPEMGDADAADAGESPAVTPYDFGERERMPSSRLRYLQFLHDRFAQQLSLALSAYLRNATSVELEGVQLSSGRRILRELDDPIAIFLATADQKGGSVGLVIDNPLALGFVDRLLGGASEDAPPERALTEIEQRVLQALAEIVFSTLSRSWSPIVEETMTVEKVETRPALITLEPPEEGRVVLKFKVGLSAGEGAPLADMRVILPMSIANPLSTELAKDLGQERGGMALSPEKSKKLESMLLRTTLELAVDLAGNGVTAGDLLRMRVGHVLKLGRSMEEPATVRIGGVPKFNAVLALRGGQPAVELKDSIDAN